MIARQMEFDTDINVDLKYVSTVAADREATCAFGGTLSVCRKAHGIHETRDICS